MSNDEYHLTEIEKATLRMLAEACGYSIHAHPPENAILSKTATHLRGDVKKSLHKLHKKGLCMKHPTRGATTYQITPNGIRLAQL